MREILNKIFITLFFCLLGGISQAAPQDSLETAEASGSVSINQKYIWHKSANADGISVYWSKAAGNPVVAFKGEGIVDAPLEKVASVITDTSRGTEWIDKLVESRILRSISPSEFIEYDHMGVPVPLTAVIKDRDFVSNVRLENDPLTRRITIRYRSVEDSLAPVSNKYVRGKLIQCVFRLVPMSFPDQTFVEAEFHCDPEGSLSKWMVNFFQENWPLATFKNLRKEVKKPGIQVLPAIQSLLNPSPDFAKVNTPQN